MHALRSNVIPKHVTPVTCEHECHTYIGGVHTGILLFHLFAACFRSECVVLLRGKKVSQGQIVFVGAATRQSSPERLRGGLSVFRREEWRKSCSPCWTFHGTELHTPANNVGVGEQPRTALPVASLKFVDLFGFVAVNSGL